MTTQQAKLYSCLGTTSRRALIKTKKRNGSPYYYNPRGDLLERLSRELGVGIEDVYLRLQDLRSVLLKDLGLL